MLPKISFATLIMYFLCYSAIVAADEKQIPSKTIKSTVSTKKKIQTKEVKKLRLAILDLNINTKKLDPVIGKSLSSVLAMELLLKGNDLYEVISRNDIRNILKNQTYAQFLGCKGSKCAIDIGQIVNADHIVTSSISNLGDKWIFNLQLIDVKKGIVISRQSVSWNGLKDDLIDLCRPYATKLINRSDADNYTGSVEILTNETNATIHMNDVLIGKSPVKIVSKLPIGKHKVQIFKHGYLPYKSDFIVNHNETSLLQVQLVDESTLKPWYHKWWVWTGASVILGTGLATAYLMRDEPTTTLRVKAHIPK